MPNACPSSEDRALPEVATSHDHQQRELVAIVRAARAGNVDAWTRLVRRFDGTLRHIARSYRLAPADVDEVIQETWLVLLEKIERIREPAAIGAWLATTTRRNALRRRQMHVREQLTDDPRPEDPSDDNDTETIVLALERRDVLIGAFATLPDRHRRLLTVLLTEPTLDYRQVGELLSMPVGSIGPTRARALGRLAGDAQLRALSEAGWV